jgi:predicted transcriptional regulator
VAVAVVEFTMVMEHHEMVELVEAETVLLQALVKLEMAPTVLAVAVAVMDVTVASAPKVEMVVVELLLLGTGTRSYHGN